MQPPELAGDKVLLAAPTEADADLITMLCQDPEIPRWTTVPTPYTRAHALHFLREGVGPGWAAETGFVWAVREPRTRLVHGMVGLHDVRLGDAEIGFWMGAETRGRGWTTEAVRLVCRWGFEVLGLARVGWIAAVGNVGSRRVAEKTGFTMEGTLRAKVATGTGRYDGWVGSLLPGELR